MKLAKPAAIGQEMPMRHECIILAEQPGALVELCGITVLERLLRTLQRCGLQRATILSATPDIFARALANPSPHRAKVALEIRSRTGDPLSCREIAGASPNDTPPEVLVLAGDRVFDPRLLRLLDEQNASLALVDSAPPEDLQSLVATAAHSTRGHICGAALLNRDWAPGRTGALEEALEKEIDAGQLELLDVASGAWYYPALRRNLRPYWFPAPAPEQRKSAENLLLRATQKGKLDLPALVHAPIENFLVSLLWKTAITPNQLTLLTNLVAWGATFLFVTGRLGWGTILALAVGVLDGLDGKQARVKVETTNFGKLEHWFDALFENSWWISLAYYFQNTGQIPGAFVYLLLWLCAEAVAGLSKWSVIRACGRTIDEIGELNRLVRLVGGRRNIYVWILALGILLGAPAVAFKLIPWWAVATAAVQVPRAVFAIWLHRPQPAPT